MLAETPVKRKQLVDNPRASECPLNSSVTKSGQMYTVCDINEDKFQELISTLKED